MFFAQQQHHHHLSSNSISISSVTTKRIRWERLDIARFFFPLSLSLSLCLSRASGRVVSRRDRPLEEVFCFTLLFLLLSSLSSSSSSRWWWWWWWEMREKRDPKDRDPRGIFKSALVFLPKVWLSNTKDTENTLYSERSLSTEESSTSHIKLTPTR